MTERKEKLIPVINVNDSVTKSKFDNLYSCRESLAESGVGWIRREAAAIPPRSPSTWQPEPSRPAP